MVSLIIFILIMALIAWVFMRFFPGPVGTIAAIICAIIALVKLLHHFGYIDTL